MISRLELARSLFGAYRLAHLDPAGLSHFNRTVAGFWNSFWAAAVAGPAYAFSVMTQIGRLPEDADLLSVFLIEAGIYAIGWLAFPVAADIAVRLLGREERYVDYIVAYNWCTVLQLVAYTPIAALSAAGAIESVFGLMLAVSIILAMFYFQWFVARTALGVGALPAIAFVVLDVVLSLLITRLAAAMIGVEGTT